ncbi:MAG TPA: hypothetical protein VLC10_04450 [Patescibacteria group bacterium]|nr:hypothetical protein [Patescibacteria group bacterium]
MSPRTVFALLCALMLALLAGTASAQQPDVAARLADARHGVIALQQTADAGIITRTQAEEGTRRYLAQAAEAAGHPVTLDQLMAAPDPSGAASPAQLTALQRFAGLITFVNILWVIGIALGVICFAFLFGSYVVELVKLLVNVPLAFYEVVFYAGSLGLAIWGRSLSPGVAPYVGLTGCLLFGAAVMFTAKAHKSLNLGGALVSATMCLAWSIAALSYGSSLLGFIAVAALMSAFGFSVLVMPLAYCIGFKDEASIGRATAAAFSILTAYVIVRALGADPSILRVFEGGALFLGSFVGYLGLLITSSRWYDGKSRNYVLFQFGTIAAGVAALFVGSYFGISELQKIGGTFFVLYLLEKIIEIPAKSARGYAAVGLVASLAIFGFCMYVKHDPETLRPYVFMFR